jgi:hypothetical protein
MVDATFLLDEHNIEVGSKAYDNVDAMSIVGHRVVFFMRISDVLAIRNAKPQDPALSDLHFTHMPVAARFFLGMSSCSSAAVPAPSGIFEQDMMVTREGSGVHRVYDAFRRNMM